MSAERSKRYRERHADKLRQQSAEWRANNLEKSKAHAAVQYAVRKGTLVAPERCQHCDGACKLESHHEDYSKPLEVLWLCHACHMRRHGRTLRPNGVLVGERIGNSKLTAGDVLNIRALHGGAWTGAELARQYKVCEATISQILRRVIWKHL